MSQEKVLMLVLMGLLAACDFSPTRAPTTEATADAAQTRPPSTENAASANVTRASTCPAQNFDAFLTAFMDDEKVQRAFTKYPYTVISYDPQNLDADPGTAHLNASEISFPVMLSRTELERNGVSVEVKRKEKDWYEVSTESDGSGAYSKVFNFRRLPGCWFLTNTVDAST